MKIVSDDVSISIDFVETYNTYDDDLGDFFAINAEVRTATFSGMGKNIWYAYNEFEKFIHDLEMMVEKGYGTVMIQPPTEASEDYALNGDGLNLRFSMIIPPHLSGNVDLGVGRSDLYQQPSIQMLHISYGISSTNILSLIADLETFKGIVAGDLTRRAKEEKAED